MDDSTTQFRAILDCLARFQDENEKPSGDRDPEECLGLRDEFVGRLLGLATSIRDGATMPDLEEA